MSGLSQDQVEKRAEIQKSATIFGAIIGGIAGLLAIWLLGGQGSAIRYGGAIVIAGVVGYLVFNASFKSKAKTAACEKCGAAFSRTRTDHVETLKSSAPKEEREEQEDKSTKVTTWTEDTFDVVDTYTCGKCNDATTKTYETTRRRDEETIVEPYVTPKSTLASTSTGKGAAGQSAGAKGGSAQTGNSRSGKSRSS